jgi:hypothetical protein
MATTNCADNTRTAHCADRRKTVPALSATILSRQRHDVGEGMSETGPIRDYFANVPNVPTTSASWRVIIEVVL